MRNAQSTLAEGRKATRITAQGWTGIEDMITMKVSELQANPENIRHDLSPDATGMSDLVESVKQMGILQPLVVRTDGVVIAGHRRLLAASIAGLDSVPIVLRDATPVQMIELALIENVQRQDLSAKDEAVAYKTLTGLGLTQQEIAKRTGISYTRISTFLRFLKLDTKLIEAVNAGKMAMRGAFAISGINSPKERDVITSEALDGNFTESEIKEHIRAKTGGSNGHVSRTTGLTNTEKQWRQSVRPLTEASGASGSVILRNAIDGLRLIEDALCFYPEYIPYVEALAATRENLETESAKERPVDSRPLLLNAATEREIELKRDRAEGEGYKAVGGLQYNDEADEFYIKMVKRD